MEKYKNPIIVLLSSIIIALLFVVVNNHFAHNKELQAIETSIIEQKQLSDNIVRSLSKYSTRDDLENIIKENKIDLSAIEKDLKKLNGEVKSLSTITVVSNGYTGNNIPSTTIEPRKEDKQETKVDVNNNSYYFNLKERFNKDVPFGNVGFHGWKKDPWEINVYKREYKISTVLATTEDDRQLAYNKFTIKVNDKDYEIGIDKAEVLQVYPEYKVRFSPNLYGSFNTGISFDREFYNSASVMVGLFNYGRTKNMTDIVLGQIGIGYDGNSVILAITPVSYRISKHIPMTSNLFVAPSYSINTSGTSAIGLSFQLKF